MSRNAKRVAAGIKQPSALPLVVRTAWEHESAREEECELSQLLTSDLQTHTIMYLKAPGHTASHSLSLLRVFHTYCVLLAYMCSTRKPIYQALPLFPAPSKPSCCRSRPLCTCGAKVYVRFPVRWSIRHPHGRPTRGRGRPGSGALSLHSLSPHALHSSMTSTAQ